MTVSNTDRMKLIWFFGKANNYVIGEKINLGKKFKHRTITHFLKMFILSKIKPNANNCMDIEKKNQNARCVSPMGSVVGW